MNNQTTAELEGGSGIVAKLKIGPRAMLAICFVMLAGLGWLDYVTGYELSFFVFYSAPIGMAAWYIGRWPAILVALGATVAWLLADRFGGVKYTQAFLYYWNSTIHFLAFIINAVTIAKIKTDLDQRRVVTEELKKTQAALRALSARPAVCPACGHALDPQTADEKPKAGLRAP